MRAFQLFLYFQLDDDDLESAHFQFAFMSENRNEVKRMLDRISCCVLPQGRKLRTDVL